MSLLQQIAEVANERVVLDPAKLESEWQNTCAFSCPEGERRQLAVTEVVAAFEACVIALHDKLTAAAPAIFYVWHDEQAGQLRCSTTSLPADQLPFTARVVKTPLTKIVEDFLSDPGFVPWNELEEVDGDPDAPEPEWTLEVWFREIRVTSSSGERSGVLKRMTETGEVIPAAELGMPNLVPELAPEVESLSDLVVAERDRDRERGRDASC